MPEKPNESRTDSGETNVGYPRTEDKIMETAIMEIIPMVPPSSPGVASNN
jgi:hypothetical protein